MHAFAAEPKTHAGHPVPRIWVVIADRKQAHIYRKTGKGLEHIVDALAEGAPGSAAGMTQNQGHVRAAMGSVRYVSDPRDRTQRHDDLNFIQGMARWLEDAVRQDAFDRLVLVAAPRTLGDLRTALSAPVHARIMAEVGKDLTNMPQNKLRQELNEIAWF